MIFKRLQQYYNGRYEPPKKDRYRGDIMTEVVAALIWKNNKFMICQRPVHKARGLLWEFVGGKVEQGETKERALIRECREELAVTPAVGDVFMDVTRKNILATRVLHSKYTVIHPLNLPGRIVDEGYDACHAENLEFFRSLIPDLEKNGVKIALEPMWVRDAEKNIRSCVCSRPEEILQFLDELGTEHFCACPDLGHIALTARDTGDTPGGAIRKLGGATKIIHAHEVTKNLDAHTKPYTYSGVMDWADIGAALREVGYEGTFNFEIGANYYKPYPDGLVPEALRHLAAIGKSIVG